MKGTVFHVAAVVLLALMLTVRGQAIGPLPEAEPAAAQEGPYPEELEEAFNQLGGFLSGFSPEAEPVAPGGAHPEELVEAFNQLGGLLSGFSPEAVPAAPGGTHPEELGEGFNQLGGFLSGFFGLLGGLEQVAPKKWRDDYQCGPGYPAEDGNPAECDPDGIYPCCSPHNWCGITSEHCDCPDCVDYREGGSGSGSGTDDAGDGQTWRDDNRCGWGFPADGAEEAECNPNGIFACCSPYGWCGVTSEYCDCPGCVDYGYYGVRNLGCYEDNESRMMPYGPHIFRETLTNDICIEYCREMGFPYAGTEYYEECFCGTEDDFIDNLEGKNILYESCDTPCVGDGPDITTMCGGAWKLSVFKVGEAK